MIYGEGRLKPSRARGKQQPDGSADQRGNRNPMGGSRTCERTRATATRWKGRRHGRLGATSARPPPAR